MPAPITLLALGTRGDVEPMLLLAARLREHGREAVVVGADDYAGLAGDLGVDYWSVGPGLDEVQRLAGTALGRAARRIDLLQPVLLRRWFGILAAGIADRLPQVSAGSLLVTGLGGQAAAAALAQDRGCRVVTVLHTGLMPTAHRDSHVLGAAVPAPLRRWATSLAWRSTHSMSRPAARLLRTKLGLPGQGAPPAAGGPVLLAADPVLVPPAGDWPANLVQTAAIRPGRSDYRPPDWLARFLADGPPPVYLGLGSLTEAPGDHWQRLIRGAAADTGRRLLTPAAGQLPSGPLNAQLALLPPLPHDWLFPRVAGVIHHGGAGTTAAGLRAGVPSAAVPLVLDQPYHGRRLAELGVGPAPVPLPRLTTTRLAGLIVAVAGDSHRERAAAVGREARGRDGLALTVDRLIALA